MDATALLRPGLLDGLVVALGGDTALGPPLTALGAATPVLASAVEEDAAAEGVQAVLASHGRLDMLLHDLRPAFGAGGHDGLRAALDSAWVAIRAVATTAFIPGGQGGRVVVVAPVPHVDDPSAAGVRAAAENMARTLSIEWARHAVTAVAITPSETTTEAEIASLAAYLASPAGAYFSGCRLALSDALPSDGLRPPQA